MKQIIVTTELREKVAEALEMLYIRHGYCQLAMETEITPDEWEEYETDRDLISHFTNELLSVLEIKFPDTPIITKRPFGRNLLGISSVLYDLTDEQFLDFFTMPIIDYEEWLTPMPEALETVVHQTVGRRIKF